MDRRKMLATIGVVGASALLGKSLQGVQASSVTEMVYGTGPSQADEINYKYATGLTERTVAERLRDRVSVKDYGARGDDNTNDTAAINAAIAAVFGAGGGTVYVPKGTYLIDAVRPPGSGAGGVQLKSNVSLVLDQGAVFQALPNNQGTYMIISIFDCVRASVIGGTLIGERYTHTGTTGEWGMGIHIQRSQQVFVQGVNIRDCWGDGFYVRASSGTIVNCVCDNNRRQGMSIVSANNLYINGCVFQNTNGALPEAGVDIEPDNAADHVRHVVFENCQFLNNAGRGFAADIRNGTVCEHIQLINCVSQGNIRHSAIVLTRGGATTRHIAFRGCRFDEVRFGVTASPEPIDYIVMDQVTCKLIEFCNVTHAVIANSFVLGGGVTFQGSSDVVVTRTTISDAPAHAFSFIPGISKRITLDQLTIHQAVGSGIAAQLTTVQHLQVTGCVIRDCGGSGLTGGGHDGAFTTNLIINHALYGIDADPSIRSNLVTGNRVSGNGAGAVRGLTDPSHVIANNIGF
ncbi:right-handed parallel beta-helix repeat-containing protein [Paenibacillus hodogayensis]|uniref:Right-handed parallel beta-helix repeat-containing protein n=1 Tax=Paenibacillus hodogayensis TaxID=279208 RepID=A0ABV5W0J6_9BACL